MTLRNWAPTFDELCDKFREPEVGEKDGAYLVRGPVDEHCTRADNNIDKANLIVLDCDSSIEWQTGKIVEGAPAPDLVHQALRDLNIQHLLHTTHSHGGKGNRYRVLVPVDRAVENPAELRACVDWLIYKLHAAGVPLNAVNENYRWAQPWFTARVRAKGAPFVFLRYRSGVAMSVDRCVKWAAKNTAHDRHVAAAAAPTKPLTVEEPGASWIDKFNAQHGTAAALLERLAAHGYRIDGQTQINGNVAYRLLAPGSGSGVPGVIVFHAQDDRCRVCSHHGSGSDQLAVRSAAGKALALDAFDVFRVLEHQGDVGKAVAAIIPKKPLVEVYGGSLHRNVAQAISLIADLDPPLIFQRGATLVRVAILQDRHPENDCTIPDGTPVMIQITATDLAVRLNQMARWKKIIGKDKNRKKIYRNINAPTDVARGVLAQQGDWGQIPRISTVIETPIIRNDGSMQDQGGYDADSTLYYVGTCPALKVLRKPTRDDARAAAKVILAVFSEFPFVDAKVARSVILAYLLTLIVRGQLSLAPLFAVTATAAGSGKGLLIEAINLIVRGRDAVIMSAISSSGSEEEMRKRITALLLQGVSSVNLDNWGAALGGEALNTLLTAGEWSDRVLGLSKSVTLPNRATWAATGNNLTVRGDMVRRTLLIEIDTENEHPELRKFKIPDLPRYVLQHRQQLLSAAFTILRAYAHAGRPRVDGTPLGRFNSWWRAVCAPIIWLGRPDPTLSQDKLRADDPETQKLGRVLNACYRQFQGGTFAVADVMRVITDDGTPLDKTARVLKEVLMEDFGKRGFVDPKLFGWYLRQKSRRIVKGKRLVRVESGGKGKYYVEKMR